MKYFAVSGRIPGDDEDTTLGVGRCSSMDEAYRGFVSLMEATLREQDVAALHAAHGTTVFVNSIVSSDSPIEVEQ